MASDNLVPRPPGEVGWGWVKGGRVGGGGVEGKISIKRMGGRGGGGLFIAVVARFGQDVVVKK